DEVVHGKASLVYKMPGDDWQKFGNMRVLYGYMYTHPGNKLLFMGDEWGQTKEWNYQTELQWDLMLYPLHAQLSHLVKTLNELFRTERALYELQYDPEGFQWVDYTDAEQSVACYLRKGKKKKDALLIICNFTPETRDKYRIGVPKGDKWEMVLNTDNPEFGGSDYLTRKSFKGAKKSSHGFDHSLSVNLPPLSCLILRHKGS
ncbi:MAG: alpha amylase C-terminal domain-containing protein, partial [Saprospiraceae bacterium]|nr:alpha amylase C-terminal domain-containing protein [Saprospiraceae bacterium]